MREKKKKNYSFNELPCSEGAFWVLLRPTSEIFATPPSAQEVAVPSDQWKRGRPTLCSKMLYKGVRQRWNVHGLYSDSAAPSLWLIRRLGMVSRLSCV